MSKIDIWQVAPYVLPILSYVIGKRRSRFGIPRPISVLLDNAEVIRVVIQGIEAAETMRDKTDDERRRYVREWAKSELYKLLGDRLPDSTINYLIEHTLVRRKTEAGPG